MQKKVDEAIRLEVSKALEVLKKGGVILYPTDTVWGIGCDATRPEAIDRIYQLKKRAESKSMLLLVDGPNRISRYIREFPELANDLIDLSESPLTIIYPDAINLPDSLIAEDKSIGIRVCKHELCQLLIRGLNRPIVSTSANISGEVAPKRLSEVAKEIINGVDFVVNPQFEGHPTFKPSSIIKLGLKGEVEVIRE